MIMAYFERKGCVQRNLETAKTVYHYEKVLKAGDQRDIVWFVSNTCYFIGETLARVRRAYV